MNNLVITNVHEMRKYIKHTYITCYFETKNMVINLIPSLPGDFSLNSA